MVSIILIVVSMATVNIFVKIVNERIQEIGTMRSIGFQPRHILVLFCSEAAMLAAVGAIGGTVCSLIVAAIANHYQPLYNAGLLNEGVPFRLDMQAFDFVWITALITGLMMISTLLPVWKATKARVADLLADKG
ncbi:MAG: FtsX-like permease family protein [Proteobacteria bacterium]|nr:MAG: FtsX-like permease family protein [Pseudomonadota bacterium]